MNTLSHQTFLEKRRQLSHGSPGDLYVLIWLFSLLKKTLLSPIQSSLTENREFFRVSQVKRPIQIYRLFLLLRCLRKRPSSIKCTRIRMSHNSITSTSTRSTRKTRFTESSIVYRRLGVASLRPCRASNLAYALRVYNATFSSNTRGMRIVDRLTVGRTEQTVS